jgi:hypothetical protein
MDWMLGIQCDLQAFRGAWLLVFFCSQTVSTPAHTHVMQIVGQFLAKGELSKWSYLAELYIPAIRHSQQGEDNEKTINLTDNRPNN